ncbi:EamA family transporter [Halosegnis longus]|uniref:EamA family transporter n=1 Tax=Halosegnis longus TaxID=2216012 RepID=UPI00096A234B|nr:DMT family transporter [Salella cibi]
MNLDSLWSRLPTAPLLFVTIALLWGGSFVAIERGVESWPPLLFAGLRYALAGVLVLGIARLRHTQLAVRTRDDWLAVAVTGVFVIFAHHALLYVGQETVPGAVASALIALSPVVTVLLAPLVVGDDRLTPVALVGVAVGFLGAVTIAGPGGGGDLRGIALIAGATVAFAFGSLLLRRVEPTLSLAGMQGWGMLLGAGLLLVGSRGLGEPLTIPGSPVALATLVYLVVGPGVIAFLLYFRLLATVGPSRANLVGYLEPVAATGLAVILLGYEPTLETLVGFALVAVGFALVDGRRVRGVARTLAGRVRASVA